MTDATYSSDGFYEMFTAFLAAAEPADDPEAVLVEFIPMADPVPDRLPQGTGAV